MLKKTTPRQVVATEEINGKGSSCGYQERRMRPLDNARQNLVQ